MADFEHRAMQYFHDAVDKVKSVATTAKNVVGNLSGVREAKQVEADIESKLPKK